MKRITAAACFLIAAVLRGDPSTPAPRHTLFVAPSVTAPKPETRDALQIAIDDFFHGRLRRLAPATLNADYSYLSFTVDARGHLTSSFGVRSETPRSFPDGCSSCELDERLMRVVEKTLFKHARLYTDVSLRDCSPNDLRTRVKITVAPNTAAGGIEPKFFYRARLTVLNSESDVTLSPYDDNEIDDASAWFEVHGTADNEFLLKCSLKQLGDFVLVPHPAAPVDTGSTNQNAKSATREKP